MNELNPIMRHRKLLATFSVAVAIGLAAGAVSGKSIAEMSVPIEHKGLQITALGVVSEEQMIEAVGLSGYILQLREITIEPGGQIASHSHEGRPGLVQVIRGTWTEGRPTGAADYTATSEAIVEDNDTVHWFWNTGGEAATAIVCDIVPTS